MRRLFLLAVPFVAVGCADGPQPATPQPMPTAPAWVAPLAAAVCPAGMAALPAGTYTRMYGRAPSTVAAFCIDETEVTTDAFATCVKNGACTVGHARSPAGCNLETPGRGDHPVNCVTWAEAATFCKAEGKRLPSEDEWEWAARGGTLGRSFPWGEEPIKAQGCWSSGATPRDSTCPVGAFPAGDAPGGIHDMLGNVEEWTGSACAECGDARQPRGGGFATRMPSMASQSWKPPDERLPDRGFRCAK